MIHKIEITMETNGTPFPDYEIAYTDNLDKRKIETMLKVALHEIQTDPRWDTYKNGVIQVFDEIMEVKK